MATLIYRATKGSPLTSAEGDANVKFLSDRAEAGGLDVRRFISGNGTTVTDAAIVSAIAAMPETGGKLLLPAGLTYALNNPIVVNKAVEIEGQGKASMYRTQKPTNLVVNHTGAAFTMQHSGSLFHKFHLEYAGTQSSSTTASKGIVVDIREVVQQFASQYPNGLPSSYGIDRVSTANFATGIHQLNGAEGQITLCDFHTFYQYGLQLECQLLHDLGDMSLIGCNFYSERYNSIAGVFQQSGGGAKFSSCKWNQRAGKLMQFGYYAALQGSATSIVKFSNNSLENIGETSIKIVPGAFFFEMVSITDNEFANYSFNGLPNPKDYIDLQGVKGSSVIGNTFRKLNTLGVAIKLDSACTDYSVVPNTFFEYPNIGSAVSIASGATASVQFGGVTSAPTNTTPTAPSGEQTFTDTFVDATGARWIDQSLGTGTTTRQNGLTLTPGSGNDAGRAALVSNYTYPGVGKRAVCRLTSALPNNNVNTNTNFWIGDALAGSAKSARYAIQGGALYAQYGDAHGAFQTSVYSPTAHAYLAITLRADNTVLFEVSADGTTWNSYFTMPTESIVATAMKIGVSASDYTGGNGPTATVASISLT